MFEWLAPALIALFSFGLWGFFTKLAIATIDAKSALFFQTIGVMLIGLVTFYFMHFKINLNIKGASFGLLTGFAYGIGCLFYLIAAGKGKIVTVVTLTALYPLITLLLAYYFLHESLSVKQTFGIVLALMAILFMSS